MSLLSQQILNSITLPSVTNLATVNIVTNIAINGRLVLFTSCISHFSIKFYNQ